MSENTMDAKDLKILAYKEKVASLEEANIDLRVNLTFLAQELDEARGQVERLQADEEKSEDVSSEEA